MCFAFAVVLNNLHSHIIYTLDFVIYQIYTTLQGMRMLNMSGAASVLVFYVRLTVNFLGLHVSEWILYVRYKNKQAE